MLGGCFSNWERNKTISIIVYSDIRFYVITLLYTRRFFLDLFGFILWLWIGLREGFTLVFSEEINIGDYIVQLNHGVYYTSLNVFNATRINNNTTFTPKIYYRGAQSFLSLLMGDVSGSYMPVSYTQLTLPTNREV